MAAGKEIIIMKRLYPRRFQTPSTGAEYLLLAPAFSEPPPGEIRIKAEMTKEVKTLGTSRIYGMSI